MRHLLLFLLLLLSTVAAGAADTPVITGVTGTVTHGQSITITGSGFGATGPAIRLYDSFEQGDNGSIIATTAGSATIGNWTALGNTSQTYSTDHALSGSTSLRVNWGPNYGSGPRLSYPDVQNADMLVSWWQFMPTGARVPYSSGDGLYNWKWFWIGDASDGWPWGSDFVTVCLDAACGAAIAAFPADDIEAPQRSGGTWYNTLFTKGEWMRVTVALRNATAGGYVWKQEIDGNTQAIAVNVADVTTAHNNDPWNVLTLPGFGHQDAQATLYIDDVYVATGSAARARVELGNAATYGACTRLSLLTPTAWADGSVTATVRAGNFAAGQPAYLFVINSFGVTSSGCPVTIGGTASPAEIPPAPTGLVITGTTP